MYICFAPDTGKIISIGNLIPSGDYIEVDIEDVRAVHTGKESSDKFIILYNSVLGIYELKKKNFLNILDKTINEILYLVPNNETRNGITIIQDIKNSCWKFLINGQLEAELKSTSSYTNYFLYFSVTEFENPNILFKQLSINLEQLIKNHYLILPFNSEFEIDYNINCSVYTNKIFEYNYERN